MCCCPGVSYCVACGVFVAFSAVGFTLLALVTPHWLENNGLHDNPPFDKLGLWQMCLRDFSSHHTFYEQHLAGCHWVYNHHFVDMDFFIRPRFYAASQVLFCGAALFSCISLILAVTVMFCVGHRRETGVLRAIALTSFLAAVFGSASVSVFAVYAPARDWMPDWQNNQLSWSFFSACIGVVLLWLSVVVFFVKSRRVSKVFSVARGVYYHDYHLTSHL